MSGDNNLIINFIATNISFFNIFLILISIVLFIFSKRIISFLDTNDLEKKNLNGTDLKNIDKKQKFLKLITLLVISIYFTTFYIQLPFLNDIMKVIFIILIIYILNSWVNRKILIFYGNEIEIGGEVYIKRGYKTQIFSLITSIISLIFLGYFTFKVFGIDSLLEGGGIIAGILAFIGFTAHVWGADLVASVMILHNGEIETGNVIRIKEKGILAWVKNINLSEVKLIDLVYGNPIIMRPSQLRNQDVENLSNGVMGKRASLLSTIDIKVGYEINKEDLEDLVFSAFDAMIADFPLQTPERSYFPEEPRKSLDIDSFGDDAVHYKFGYSISNPFYIVKASRLLNTYLLKYQKEKNIFFATPKLVNVSK